MRHKKITVLMVFVFVLAMGVWTVTAGSLLEQRAVLSGTVISFAQVGMQVEEGTELVRVNTLAGSATAARATARGIIKEVLVQQDSKINSGDVVVRIEAR